MNTNREAQHEERLPLLGVVMAGGKSSRMGQDKGRLAFDGSPMASRVLRLLRAVGLDVRVSVAKSQLAEYARLWPDERLIADEALAVEGPLRGILSVHAADPLSDLLVVACDMPLLEAGVLERLIEARRSSRGLEGAAGAGDPISGSRTHSEGPADYIAFDSDGIQPLAAIYTASALSRLRLQLRQGDLPPFCPRKLMGQSATLLLQPENERERLQFTNVNRPEEFHEAEQRMRVTHGHA